jgi:hypothetical protein
MVLTSVLHWRDGCSNDFGRPSLEGDRKNSRLARNTNFPEADTRDRFVGAADRRGDDVVGGNPVRRRDEAGR